MICMRESKIQSNGRDKLKAWGWWVTKIIQSSTNGIPDTLALRNGRVVFIEWKATGKDAEDLQKYVHMKIREQGIEVIVADSLNDIQHLR
jgi:Holliday junction resolvase